MIRILLVDDQPAVRQGLRMQLALEADLEIAGEAADADQALAQAEALSPDVVLMDVQMPGVDGIEATRRLRDRSPHSAVVILTLRDDAATRARAQSAGAAAFVAKCEPNDRLLAAIRGATRNK